jgi:hypothetical protein
MSTAVDLFGDLITERSRDHWIAANAAAQIAECKPIENIESEALDALATWIQFELQDRHNRSE